MRSYARVAFHRELFRRNRPMPILAFANSKGGSGKTTSALLLACELAESKPVTVIDADPR